MSPSPSSSGFPSQIAGVTSVWHSRTANNIPVAELVLETANQLAVPFVVHSVATALDEEDLLGISELSMSIG
jgi:hypothetical protein